ncbi:hypothetical protein C8J57DRAFT_363043 [Mycena rebaudengoi]|nr:hypothetical protein C8J57DRAFT_363043 [Mycena rebaudengoi]
MFSFASLTATCVLAVLGSAYATPLSSRQSVPCNPNFEGAGVSIISPGGVEWAASPVVAGTALTRSAGGFPANATANWHVQQTGSANPTYIVKEINHNDLVVDVVDGHLTLEELPVGGAKPTQIWEISCNQCFSGASSTPGGGEFGVGCTIKSAPSGLCVELEHASDFIRIAECNPVVAQVFDFWTATA